MNKKKIFIGIFIVLLIGFMGFAVYKSKAQGKAGDVYVKTEEVKEESIESIIFTSGTVKADKKRNIIAESSGSVKYIGFEEGDKIEKGQVFIKLDTEEIENQISNQKLSKAIKEANLLKLKQSGKVNYTSAFKNAKLSYEASKETYAQNQVLFQRGAISEKSLRASKNQMSKLYNEYLSIKDKYEGSNISTDLEISDLQLDQLDLQLEELENKLEKSNIKVPIDGTITRVNLEVGDYITAKTVVGEVQNLNDLIVHTKINQYDIKNIEVGQSVMISRRGDMKDLEGKVTKISETAEKSGEASVIPIEIVITSENDYRPNYSVNVEIKTAEKADALVVPYEAILKDKENRSYIFIVTDEKAKKVMVEEGIRGALNVEVISDEIKKDDQVIINPDESVKDGILVELMN